MTSQAPAKNLRSDRAAPAAVRINGVYDLPSPSRIAGWAIDRADPDAAVEVEIYREGALLQRTRADRFRPDLERGGIGTGRYGFSVDLDPPVAPEMVFTLTVRAVTGDGTSGPLRPTGEATPNDDPLLRLLERTFDEMAVLKADIATLRRSVEAGGDPPEHKEIVAVLDRIEVVQARLDGAAAVTQTPADPAVGPGLRTAVGIALAMSALALVLGLWSVFG
ncbi:MAG TPA: hypothetical protein DIU07_01515 [Rhodobacteraceae bacterium]|nr:hypothetical protein [Paracoccaceae bacterium]